MRTQGKLTYRSRAGIFLGTSLAGILSAASCLAVLPFDVSTNGSGTVINGSWVGNGTVQPNQTAGNFNNNGVGLDVLVQNFSSGTFTINPGNLYPNPRISTNMGVSVSVSLTGGTGDFLLANSNNFDGGNTMYNSVGLTDLAGVTSITWTIEFTEPIAGRSDVVTGLDFRPIGAAIGLVAAGSGLTAGSFNVALSYDEVYSSATSDGLFISGLPGNAIPYASAGWDSPAAPGATSFVTNDGFTGTVSLGASDTDFLLVRGYDYNGSGNGYTAADSDLVYIKSLTWTITSDTGSFAAGTHFTVSMDGQQHANLEAVPEPSAGLLLGVACVGGLIWWRRGARRTA